MPNYIKNRVVINGAQSEVDKVIDFVKSTTSEGEEVTFDFNKIIPRPEALEIEDSSIGAGGKKYLLGMSGSIIERAGYMRSEHYAMMQAMKTDNPELFQKHIKVGAQYLRNIADYGHATWYGWSIENWGSKWNACDACREDNIITFETAWSGVPKIIAKLASLFPDVEIIYEYADEDVSYNIGSFIFYGETVVTKEIPENSREAYELCFSLGVAKESDYELVGGNYQYIEE